MNSGESCVQLAAAGKLSGNYNSLWQGIGPVTYFRHGKPIGLGKKNDLPRRGSDLRRDFS